VSWIAISKTFERASVSTIKERINDRAIFFRYDAEEILKALVESLRIKMGAWTSVEGWATCTPSPASVLRKFLRFEKHAPSKPAELIAMLCALA